MLLVRILYYKTLRIYPNLALSTKMLSDDASLYEADASESVPVVPVYPREDEKNDAIVVSATVVNDQEEDVRLDESTHYDDNNDSDSGTDDEEEDQRTSVSCALVVPHGIEASESGNDNSNDPTKKLKDVRKDMNPEDEEEEEEDLAISSSTTKTRKRKRPEEKKVEGIPSVKDLGIPFRAIKRIMKLHPDIATVQNEAAIVTTYALELFVKKIVNESYSNAKKRGRNTVK